MRILFIHQNMPGQFLHLSGHFARQPDTEVMFVTAAKERNIPGVKKLLYEHPSPGPLNTHRFLTNFHYATIRGQAVARILLRLKESGSSPDLIYAHPGWGEALYAKDILPDVPLINYCEFYYRGYGSDISFDPNTAVDLDFLFRVRLKNSVNLLSLESCDRGVSPTLWQWRQHPADYLSKIAVIHDGIDTERIFPVADETLDLADGIRLAKDAEVVTYVARNLEPYRGFPAFMRAVALLCRRRPSCHFVIVGGDKISYGSPHPSGKSYREVMLEEVDIDRSRVHFLGLIPYPRYLKLLRVSTVHVYLTVPFVLSWSVLEAMAAGCVVVASNTPPVAEVIEDGRNGFLVDLLSPEEIADVIEEALLNRHSLQSLRERARKTVSERYGLGECLAAQLRLIREVLANG